MQPPLFTSPFVHAEFAVYLFRYRSDFTYRYTTLPNSVLSPMAHLPSKEHTLEDGGMQQYKH